MSRTLLSINGKTYPYAHKNLLPEGGRQFSIASRPWQPGDPADKVVALYHSDGPNLFTNEEVSEQAPAGYLGIDTLDGCDSRWDKMLTLAPALTPITLTGSDAVHPEMLLDLSALLDQNTGLDASPTAGNVSAIVTTPDATGAAVHAYFARQNFVTKVDVSSNAVVATQPFNDTVTDLIATQTPSNVREVSAALQSSAYQVATPITAATNDTWAANSAGDVERVFGTDPQSIVGGQLSSGQVNWRRNILAGAVTMLAPAWNTVASIVGAQIIPTGFVVDGYRWLCGTSKGPYPVDPNLGALYPLLPSTDNNPENGRNMSFWEFIGAIIPHRYGIRFQKANVGRSFGVETFPGNRSTVQGYVTAQDGSSRWHYESVYNSITGTTWLLAWHPDSREIRQTPSGPYIMSPFVIGKIPSSNVSRAMRWVGTANQLRTTAELLIGSGTNGLSMLVGETPQEIDDPAYRYTLSGTASMTELRRYPHLLKDWEAIEFETANCNANQTITVGLTVSGDSTQPVTITLAGTTAGVNDTVKTNGYQRRLFVDNNGVPLTTATGRRGKPSFTFASNVATAAPQIIGPIRAYLTLRPILIEEVTVYLTMDNSDGREAYDKIVELQALENAAPVLVDDDWFGASYYVRVAAVDVPPEAKDMGGSDDAPRRGGVWVVPVKFHRWITSASGVTP